MLKRILGEFPVFAKLANLGKLSNVSDNIIPSGTNAFSDLDRVAYEKGFKYINPEVLNGALNFITQHLQYLYHAGVPEFSLNVSYSKGSIVTYDGALYVSLTDENTKHVSQTSHWGRFTIEHNNSLHNNYPCDKKTQDSNPIGTILTVPVTTKLEGYMDFEEGKEFSPIIYPELYKALGTNKFGYSSSGSSDLPIGSMVHILSTEEVPEGWVEWSPYVSLSLYPELLQALTEMVRRMPLGDSKQVWSEALSKNKLPMFSNTGFYLGMKGSVGSYTEDKASVGGLMSYPVVVDESNTLNPLGVSRCAVEQQKDAVSAIVSQKSYMSSVASPIALVAHKAEQHKDVDTKMVVVSEDSETVPRTVSTRLIIKATNQRPSNILSTHKQVIKYVN